MMSALVCLCLGAVSSSARAEEGDSQETRKAQAAETSEGDDGASDEAKERYETSSSADDESADRPLRVGYAGSAPFVRSSGDGAPMGLSIRVWRDLAERMGVEYDLQASKSVRTALAGVESGQLDVAVGPISITADRARRVRFSQPYFDSSIAIAAPPGASVWARIRPLVSTAFLTGLGVLFLVLTGVGAATWLVERKQNPEEFPADPIRGIGNGIWFALVTMTTVGYGDRSPKTVAGRVISGGWMLVALITTSSLTAGIATALTLVGLDRSTIKSAAELDGRRVAVVSGTLSESLASEYGGISVSAPDVASAVALVQKGNADALVFDRPALEHYLSEHSDVELELSPRKYRPQGYGFAISKDSNLGNAMNVGILQMKEEGTLPTSGADGE